MTSRLEIIRSRIQKQFQPQVLEVIDESHLHIGHAGHQGGNRHFSIIIQATCLNELSRVAAHQKIYALFTDMIPDKIHALKIKILKTNS